jgi:hypothetical protein
MPRSCRRLLSGILLPSYLLQSIACSSQRAAAPDQVHPAGSEPVSAVVTLVGERIDFNPPGVAVGDRIFGSVAGAWRGLPLDSVGQLTVLREAGIPTTIRRRELARSPGDRITGLTLVDAMYVKLDDPGGFLHADTVRGSVKGQPYRVARNDVQRFWLSRTSTGRSALLVLGVTGAALLAVVIIAYATKESCPFIYSWDGERYVFDAEPYGGAISQGLERDDYGVLEHLRADSGVYKLMVTNEVAETQRTNLLQLLVVDHDPTVRVVADEWGGLHGVRAAVAPIAARDASGRDLTAWLAGVDERIWEPAPIPGDTSDARDEVVLTFLRPRGATTARLVARLGTGLWGSHMIRSMLQLRGNEVESWYARVDADPVYRDSVKAWNVREELYGLRVDLKTAEGWQTRALLPGGGPFVFEERAVRLRLDGVAGDTIQLRLRPPRGFWALDAFALDFGPDGPLAADTLRAISAVDDRLGDVLPELSAVDDRYHELPTTRDRAYLTFVAPPPPAPGLTRTVLVHTRGWYQLHLAPAGPPDSTALRRLADEPGFIARLAAEQYGQYLLAQRRAVPAVAGR